MNAALTHRAALYLFVASACLAAPVLDAHADTPTSANAQGNADLLFEQGVAARKENKLGDAETFFRKAWALKKTWDIAANLGLVEMKLGKMAEGAEHVAYALQSLPPTESDNTRESLTKALAAARQSVAEVRIETDTVGAAVLVGGDLKGTTPLVTPLFVAPGLVTIEVRKDGYVTERRTLDAKKGGAELVRVSLHKNVAPSERSLVPAYVMGGVGAASLAAGALMLGLGFSERDALRADAPKSSDGDAACSSSTPTSAPDSLCEQLRSRGRIANTLGQPRRMRCGPVVLPQIELHVWSLGPASKAQGSLWSGRFEGDLWPWTDDMQLRSS
jgi:hypothetical protein